MNDESSVKILGMPAESGRWIFPPLGLIVLLCFGTVYSWSIFRKPLEEALKINATQSLLPFTILLVVFSILMPLTGFYMDKIGVSKVTMLGGLITGIGYILSSFTNNITILVLTYGVITGAGIGIAYGGPIALVAKWFPDKKGLAVGLTVMGFGLSPLVTAPLAKTLIASNGVSQTFLILGIAFTIITIIVSLTFFYPPQGWTPQGWTPQVKTKNSIEQEDSLWTSGSFYALWVCYTIGTFAGLSAIGISSSVAQEVIKLDKDTAALTVSIFAVFNGVGRPLFGWLTDSLKPKGAAILSYVLIIIASIIMINATQGQTASYIIAFSFFWLSLGGWLAIAPTATLNLFNPANYTSNYGIVFTAYGLGALLGTLVAGSARDIFGSYTFAFYPTAILAAIGIIIAQFKLKT